VRGMKLTAGVLTAGRARKTKCPAAVLAAQEHAAAVTQA
jgi:hypothetical protein